MDTLFLVTFLSFWANVPSTAITNLLLPFSCVNFRVVYRRDTSDVQYDAKGWMKFSFTDPLTKHKLGNQEKSPLDSVKLDTSVLELKCRKDGSVV